MFGVVRYNSKWNEKQNRYVLRQPLKRLASHKYLFCRGKKAGIKQHFQTCFRLDLMPVFGTVEKYEDILETHFSETNLQAIICKRIYINI